MRISKSMQHIGILFFRITVGLTMLAAHGWGKMIDFSAKSQSFPDPFKLGGTFSLLFTVFSEVFCSLLIMVGLFTRWSTIPLILTMLTAWYLHGVAWSDPWAKQEKAVLYLICYMTLFCLGGGKWSLDSIVRNKN